MKQTNLIVIAHPDDEILGFGAAGAKLVAAGQTVQPLILCGDADARSMRPRNEELAADMEAANETLGFAKPHLGQFPNIRMNTVPHIELVQFIESAVSKFAPTRIFTHHPADPNDDHRQVSRACLAAFRLFQRRPEIEPVISVHFMEVQSSTDWAVDTSLSPFRANLFVDIAAEIELKLQALSCYRDVMRSFPHPRSVEAIKGLAAYRGGQSGMQYAEAFETVFQRGFD